MHRSPRRKLLPCFLPPQRPHHGQKFGSRQPGGQRDLAGEVPHASHDFGVVPERVESEQPRVARVGAGEAHEMPDRRRFARAVRP